MRWILIPTSDFFFLSKLTCFLSTDIGDWFSGMFGLVLQNWVAVFKNIFPSGYDQCSQDRDPGRRIARSYELHHLDRALTLLWFSFTLFYVFFCCHFSYVSPVFCRFPSVSSVFLYFTAWFLYFSPIIYVLMLGSSVFPLFSLSISLNSISNLPIYKLCYVLSPAERSYVGSRSWLHWLW